MTKQYLNHPLPLLISLIADKSIQKVELLFHPQGFAYQINGSLKPEFEKQVLTFLKSYLSKQNSSLHFLQTNALPVFTQKVLSCLAEIPFGKSMSYGQVAESIASPKAARAVGSACGKNPFPLFIPCHRVLASNSLGGFSSGLHIKKLLLDFEGHTAFFD